MPNYDDYTDDYRRSARNNYERQTGMDREQRLMVTLSVGAALMLIAGCGIGFALGRYTAPKPKPVVKVVTAEPTVTAGAIEEVPTETVEPVVEPTASVETTPADETAPDTPKQTNPANGATGIKSSRVTLRWTTVTDDSGVTYAFEIQNRLASGSWGNAQVIKGLKSPSYSARVLPVTRRWRVWAVDGAGNVSPKSGWRTYKGAPLPVSKPATTTPSNNTTP